MVDGLENFGWRRDVGVERVTCHRSAAITGQEFGVYTRWTINNFLEGAVAGGGLADPKAFAVGVDG